MANNMFGRSSTASAPSIKISNLTLGHSVEEELSLALGPMSLEIHPGETVAFIGPSGCGKTSLLMALIGELTPISGRLEFSGQSISRGPTAMVFQSNTVFPWLNALDNVLYPLKMNSLSPKESLERALLWLKRVGLEDSGNKYPAELSGGMLQRVAVARALAYGPKLLLLDEPFGQLDELTRFDLSVLLAGLLSKSEITTVLVTHSIEEAVFIADTIVVLSSSPGQIISTVPVKFKEARTRAILDTPEFHQYRESIREALLSDRRT